MLLYKDQSFINPTDSQMIIHYKNYLKKLFPPIFQESVPPLTKHNLLKEHILANFRQLSGFIFFQS